MVSAFNTSIGPMGFGLMQLTTSTDNPLSDEDAFALLDKSLELGCNFWNAGEFYGRPPDFKDNMRLLSKYFASRPQNSDRVFLSLKGGFDLLHYRPDGSKETLEATIKEDVAILNGRPLDMFCLSRVDPQTSIEVSVAALAGQVKAGTIKHICLSECSADTLRRAHKVHPISAVEIEYSLWATESEQNGLMQACSELGVPLIAYSPLGRGLLSGRFTDATDLSPNDMRHSNDRFSVENAAKNKSFIDQIDALALRFGLTKAQLALGWVQSKSNSSGHPLIIPIPGTRTLSRLESNAVSVPLKPEQLEEVDKIVSNFTPSGFRYDEEREKWLYA